jgi:ABC-type multidrug transport system permease subunit
MFWQIVCKKEHFNIIAFFLILLCELFVTVTTQPAGGQDLRYNPGNGKRYPYSRKRPFQLWDPSNPLFNGYRSLYLQTKAPRAYS